MPSRSGYSSRATASSPRYAPRSRDVSLSLYLPRPDPDPRFARIIGRGGPRVVHMVLLADPQDVDDQVRRWLTEAFLHASD